jgi:ATP-dependent Lon protease
MEMDHLDKLAASLLDGYLVRKDLVRTFSRQFPVPTYVVEFLLGRYCASTDPEEIEEGLEVVQRQLQSRTVKAGEEELFKARAREKGIGAKALISIEIGKMFAGKHPGR